MNKKLINGLLLLAVATGGSSVLTSCKDNDDATLADVYDNQKSVADQLQALLAELSKNMGDNNDDLNDLITKLTARVKTLEDAGYLTEQDKIELQGLISAAKTAADNAQTAANNAQNTANAANTAAGNAQNAADAAQSTADAANTAAGNAQSAADAAQSTADAAQSAANSANSAAGNAQSAADAAQNTANLASKIAETNLKALALIKDYIDAKVSSVVTSIEVQRVNNHMFGSLNLPFGINSTVLGSYYYEANKAVTFPNVNDLEDSEYKINDDVMSGVRLWNSEIGVAPKTTESLPANTKKIEDLGRIYVTVNPVSVPADGLTVALVTSKGNKPVKATLNLVAEGDETPEFTFGKTTRSVANGLYYIDVPAEVSDIEGLEVKLDEGLKDSVKDFFKDQSSSSLTNIAQGVYDQLVDTNLPAYALQVSFPKNKADLSTTLLTYLGSTIQADGTVKDAQGNVVYDPKNPSGSVSNFAVTINPERDFLYSKYAIAAATMHPLSFGTGVDWSINRELPTFGRIKDAINDYFDTLKDKVKITINLGSDEWVVNFDKDKFNVNVDNIEIDLTGVPVYEVVGKDDKGNPITSDKVIGTVGNDQNPVKIVLDKDGKTGEINGVRYASIKQLIDAINAPMSEVESVINQVNSIISDLNTQLEGVNTDLNNQIQDILADIQDDMNKKLDSNNSLVKLYNKVVNKVNSLLKDPNQVLQVYAAYKENSGNLHHFSTTLTDPSLYKGKDGFTIYLTSYNGEILVPAYKKLVAISNVYKNGKEVPAAQAKSILTKANQGADFNTVLDGSRQKVAVKYSDLTPGYTYEIFYTALDYRGVTSSHKYYIEVK